MIIRFFENKTFILCFTLTLFISCGKKSTPVPSHNGVQLNQEFFERIGEVKAFDQKAHHAKSLQECVYKVKVKESCSFLKLPFLGQEKEKVNLEDIKSRLLVDHQWMGERFLELIKDIENNYELIHMIKSIRAIVISSKINVSFHSKVSNSIYLSPFYLYITQKEKDTIENKVDERSTRSQIFKFKEEIFYDYNKNHLVTQETNKEKRFKLKLSLELYRLLYHELTHANTIYPHYTLKDIPMDDKLPAEAFINGEHLNEFYYQSVDDYKTLQSINLFKLTDYKSNNNVNHVEEIQNLEALNIDQELDPDYANDIYNYANHFENSAMKLEEFLMIKNHSVPRYLSFSDRDSKIDNNESFIVLERSRILKSDILESTLDLYFSLFPDAPLEQVKREIQKFTYQKWYKEDANKVIDFMNKKQTQL